MARKQKCEWFVKPLDDFTNQAVIDLLSKTADVDEIPELPDNEGKVHRVLRVDYGTVQLIQYSKKHMPLRFRVFNRYGSHGQAREWRFSFQRKKGVKVRKISDNLAKIKEKMQK
jgi:hypothetical protein